MRPRLFERNSLRALVRAVVEGAWELFFLIRFSVFLVRLSPWGQELTAVISRVSAGVSGGNLFQREYLVALHRDPQTVRPVLLLLDANDRALKHYSGSRNLRDDYEALAQLGGAFEQHAEAARAEVFDYRVDAELLAVRREVERDRRERAACARLAAALFDRTKVFQ